MLNDAVRGKTFPFVVLIGRLKNEGVIPEDDVDQGERDYRFYENYISLLIYVKSDLTYELETKSLLEAIDILFKLYTVLKIDFAPECANVWSFLKEYIYQLDRNCCTIYTIVQNFVKTNLLKKIE